MVLFTNFKNANTKVCSQKLIALAFKLKRKRFITFCAPLTKTHHQFERGREEKNSLKLQTESRSWSKNFKFINGKLQVNFLLCYTHVGGNKYNNKKHKEKS